MSNREFSVAKNYVVNSVNNLISYLENMSTLPMRTDQKNLFYEYTSELERIKTTVINSAGDCLTDEDVKSLEQIGNTLANDIIDNYFHSPTIQGRLSLLWKLSLNIIKTADFSDIILWREKQQNQKQVTSINALSKLESVKNTTSIITDAILNENQRDVLSLSGVLVCIILRTEASEYEINNIVELAKKYTSIDIESEDLISIDTKVRKGKDKWKSDIRAMRDAISHAKFEIKSIDNSIEVHFNNQEKGYDFTKEMTKRDLLVFYQDFDRMTVIQSKLLSLALLITFIKKDLKI